MTDSPWQLTWTDEAEPAGLRPLLAAVRDTDGRPSFDDDGPLPGEFRHGSHLLAATAGSPDAVLGYAHLAAEPDADGHQVAELLVAPAARARGLGGTLLTELLTRAGVTAPGADRLRIWAHGDHPAAAGLAAARGLRRARELVRMRAPLSADLPEPRLPAGVALRAFVPGQDERAVVEVNQRAFSWHPEQGALSVADVRETEAESWFDPAGFFLAVDERDTLLGFHWTKVHPDVDGGPMGEVYVVGVDPDRQGGGLGKALTLAGLRHLAGLGLDRVMLYVESDNAPAVAVYRKLGFQLWDVDVQYSA